MISLPDVGPGNDDVDTDYDNVMHDDLTKRLKHLNETLNVFWRRWKVEYLLELREFHRHLPRQGGAADQISVGDIVIVHDENYPRGLWKLGKIEDLIRGADNNIRGAVVRVQAIIPSYSNDPFNDSIHLKSEHLRRHNG